MLGTRYTPATCKTPSAPVWFPKSLIKLLTNNLEVIPEQAYNDAIVVCNGPPRMVFFCDPELVRNILMNRNAEFPKGHVQKEVLRPMFGDAMHTKEGSEWRWQRGVAAPLFRHSELVRYGSKMTLAAEATVGEWRKGGDCVRFVDKDMLRAAYAVISNTILAGGTAAASKKIESGHADYYRGANWWILYTLFGIPHWVPRPFGFKMRQQEKRIWGTVADLVENHDPSNIDPAELMSRLLVAQDPETGKKMSNRQVIDNLVSFFVSGYETTALAMTWTLYLVALFPQWQNKIRQEVNEIVGTNPVSAEHVPKLENTKMVISEALRLYPTAPIIVRDILQDLNIDGTIVRKGTIGLIPIYAIHRHRKFWSDPNEFQPERFSPSAEKKPGKFQYMPFGAGPRICIGASFSMIEATIMIATFLRAAEFDVDRNFDPQPVSQMFLYPRNGMPLKLRLL